VVAPEHSLIKNYELKITNYNEVEQYIKDAKNKTDLDRMEAKEKTGVEVKGMKVINPFSGEEIPLFVADYVLGSYGTGAVMAVPAHDERDFEFAKKYDLEIKKSIEDKTNTDKELFTDDGMLVDSGEFTGLKSAEARDKMTTWLKKNNAGVRKINYRLRDWLVSRQRYWGAPIPVIYCESCGEMLDENLPVELPTDVDFKPTGESPLVYSKTFHNVKCPKCGSEAARRESDTMDTFVCSSWYYFRYTDHENTEEFASKENIKKWLPVDLYVGGAEHAVLHLLYARFFTKVLHNLGYIDFDEPFLKLRNQGMILAEDGRKMSKSLGNVVNPDEVVESHGADSLRMFEMFMGPLEDAKPWNTKGIVGIRKFLEKIINIVEYKTLGICDCSLGQCTTAPKPLVILLHKTIKKVGEDIKEFKFNTAIAQMMTLVNEMNRYESLPKASVEKFVQILAPFAPHIAEELWEKLGHTASVFRCGWPVYNPDKIVDEVIRLVVQVNGKLRDTIEVATDITEEDAKKIALESGTIKKWTENKEILKVVIVKGKLVNIVVK
jgi:leucyl-tRNA synthetase